MLLAIGAACGDVLNPVGTTVTRAELLALPLQSAAPPLQTVTFPVRNDMVTVRSLRHADAFGTLFIELRFPQGSLASLNGQPLTTTDTVQITIQPLAGQYGFTLSPSGLAFTLSGTPTVEFSYALYGDFTVADDEPAFADRATYAAALEVWEEVNIDQWRVARGSSVSGVDAIAAALDAPGRFLLAARR